MSKECGQTVEVIRCGREFPALHRGSSFMVTASIFISEGSKKDWEIRNNIILKAVHPQTSTILAAVEVAHGDDLG